MLSAAELERYNRQIILQGIGLSGQEKLKNSKVLIVGAGGLGSPLALYLAACGIGEIGIVDFDKVSLDNLQRQIAFTCGDIGKQKTQAIKDNLLKLNPLVNIKPYNVFLDCANALDIVKNYDIVADATDNFATRFMLNDICVLLSKTYIYASIFGFSGQASVFTKGGPCYRCMLPKPPEPEFAPNCADGGVIGAVCGIIASIGASEIIKLAAHVGESLAGRLLMVNVLDMTFRQAQIKKDENCSVCGKAPTITLNNLPNYQYFCGVQNDEINSIGARELKEKIDKKESLQIIDIRTLAQISLYKFPNAKIISLESIAARKDELDPNITAVFICQFGQRSALAIKALKKAGYKGRMLNLKDGLKEWKKD
ncbi:MAG: ThiF family adenylyltransferase [Elusimicrobiota bacterium]|jgi:adenylyltransferase/sulfurtransferase|nr:ThiF family adenylyltransferase [Elusimicrobiota bacterium]